MTWAAIWNQARRLTDPMQELDALAQGPVAQADMLLEGTIARLARKPLRIWQGLSGSEIALCVYILPDGTVRIVHGELDVTTPSCFVAEGEVLRLRYTTCARGRTDIIDLHNLDRATRFVRRTGLAHAGLAADFLPGDAAYLDLFHGVAVATHALSGADLPGVAAGTLIDTPDGARAVETLIPGDELLIDGGRIGKLRWTATREVLAIGQSAPVLIRAPYFGLNQDLTVTPATRILVCGAAVEYQFGTDAVLVQANDMVNNIAVQRDTRRPVQTFWHLMLDDHDCISVGRCSVETVLLSDLVASDGGAGAARLGRADNTPCNPVLDRAAAQSLLSHLPGARHAA